MVKDFGQFHSALHVQLNASAFNFMREGFSDYLAMVWQGGHKGRIERFKRKIRADGRFVTKKEAAKSLSASAETVNYLLSSGKLSGVRLAGHSRIILIERVAVEKLKSERAGLIDRKQTALRLGINTIQARALVSARLLSEREAYDRRSEAFYSVQEIDSLLSITTNARRCARVNRKTETVSFADALYHLACHHDITVAQLVQAILDGALKPYAVTGGPGLKALRFRQRDVEQYREAVFRQRYPDALNTLEAAKVLRAHPKIVRFLIKKKLLDSLKVRWWLAIPHTAISDFCSKYILTQTLAKEFHTSARFLTNILELEGLRPIPSSIVHQKPSYYVFHRSDVDRINLTELIKAKRNRVTAHSRLLDIVDAAKFLNVKPETLLELIANGVLTPRMMPTRKQPAKHCFTEKALCRFSGKIERYSGLVNAKRAANICGRSVSNFNARLVYRNALERVYVEGDRSRYFRKTAVEELAAKLKSLVGASDVRSTLKLSESQLCRLVESGDLRPLHGPNVDGYPLNLFSKKDVEVVRRPVTSSNKSACVKAVLSGSENPQAHSAARSLTQ